MNGLRLVTAMAVLSAVSACTGPNGPAGAAGTNGEAGAQGTAGPMGPRGRSGRRAPDRSTGASRAFRSRACRRATASTASSRSSRRASTTRSTWPTSPPRRPRRSGRRPARPAATATRLMGSQQRVAGNVGTTDGGVVVNLASGELQYRDPTTGALSTSNYLGTATVAEVYCTTCHAVTNANDPHRTGIPWTPGSFPLDDLRGRRRDQHRAQSLDRRGDGDPGERAERRQLRPWRHLHVVPPVARRRDELPDADGQRDHERPLGPARRPAGGLFTGVGGYQYAGKTYGESTHEQKLSCVDCHMVPVADNSNVPDHSFDPQLSACLGCHAGATSFDVNGLRDGHPGRAHRDRDLPQRRGAPHARFGGPVHAAHGRGARRRELGQGQPVPGGALEGGAPHAGPGGRASTTTSSSRAAAPTASTTRSTSASSSTTRTSRSRAPRSRASRGRSEAPSVMPPTTRGRLPGVARPGAAVRLALHGLLRGRASAHAPAGLRHGRRAHPPGALRLVPRRDLAGGGLGRDVVPVHDRVRGAVGRPGGAAAVDGADPHGARHAPHQGLLDASEQSDARSMGGRRRTGFQRAPSIRPGIVDPRSSAFHGTLLRSQRWSQMLDPADPQRVRSVPRGNAGARPGVTFSAPGATACTTCHSEPGGPLACSTCHGSGTRIYPPRDLCFFPGDAPTAGAHAAHVAASVASAAGIACSTCHPVPSANVASEMTGLHGDGQRRGDLRPGEDRPRGELRPRDRRVRGHVP